MGDPMLRTYSVELSGSQRAWLLGTAKAMRDLAKDDSPMVSCEWADFVEALEDAEYLGEPATV